MVKVCGVAMAMLPGYSWTSRRSSDDVVNVGTIPSSPYPLGIQSDAGQARVG
jgi:hypothetical protein